MPTFFARTLKPLILALILSAGINYVYAGWVAPNAAPPAGNINTPINTGSTAQSKTGPFTAGWNGSVYGLNVTSAGKVGIGTASPSTSLDVKGGYATSGGARDTDLKIASGGASPNAAQIYWGDNTGWKLNFGTFDASNIFQPRFTLLDTGNVGIGTTTPNKTLVVNGDTNITGNLTVNHGGSSSQSVCLSDGTNCPAGSTTYWTSAGGSDIKNINTGNVGIGTNPNSSYKLDVNGSAQTTGLTVNGASSFLGSMETENVHVNQNLAIDNNLTVSGTLTLGNWINVYDCPGVCPDAGLTMSSSCTYSTTSNLHVHWHTVSCPFAGHLVQ